MKRLMTPVALALAVACASLSGPRTTYEVHTRIRNAKAGGYAGVISIEYGTIYGNGYYDWGAFFDKEF